MTEFIDDKSQNELLTLLQDEYLPKIYSFSRMKVSRESEADELAGEIILQIVGYIRSRGHIENMNAFVWRVSKNTLCKLIRRKKRGNTTYLTESLTSSNDDVEDRIIKDEELLALKRELSLLADKYRRTTILYYFDGKTCDEISAIIGSPTGTVKWWLHEAKKFIREGMNEMREYGEKSYNPSALAMSCQCNPGTDMEPMSCAKRKSAQNILLAAYRTPISAVELSLELGIPVPYIEDEAEYLTEQQLMKKIGSKYQTDFVILSGTNFSIVDEIYNRCVPGYFNSLYNLLESEKEILLSPTFNPANFSWDRLLWMYLHLFTDINLCDFNNKVCGKVSFCNIPDRPNGGKWIALGWETNFPSEQLEGDVKEYRPYDGPVHKVDNDYAQGFFHYWSGLDSSVFFDIPDGVFALCREIIKGNKQPHNLGDDEKLLFCHAVEKSLFIKEDGCFKLNYCFIGAEQNKYIRSLCGKFYENAATYFSSAYDIVLAECEKTIPKHLHWQMGNLLSNYLNCFVTGSLYEAYGKKLLSQPDERNKTWLSLFAVDY